MSIQNPNEPPYSTPGASTYDPVTGAPQTPGAVPPPYPGAGYPGFVPPPPAVGGPNPLLAALLGAIPGVGAMYNGQFAKGIAHIAIFAIFQSLAHHGPDIFGFLVAGWEFYMIFEAYQTARARQEGTPLPDPFGLNNIGDRFGFRPHQHPDLNNAWSQTVGKMPGAAPIADVPPFNPATGAPYYPQTGASGAQATYQVDPAGNVSSTFPPGAVPPPPPPGWAGANYNAAYAPGGAPYAPGGYPPPPPPPPNYGGYGVPPIPPVPPMPPARGSNLPMGALWLIGLGFFALLGSLRPFRFLEGEATGGLFLIGLSVFMFLRRQSLASAFSGGSSPAARWNLLRTSRGAGVVFIVGLLTLLQGLHVVDWESSWPILLIFLGVITLMERLALNKMSTAAYPVAPVAPVPPEPVVETSSPTSIVPKYTRPENDLTDGGGR